jgi:large subunit ribosomal protein L32
MSVPKKRRTSSSVGQRRSHHALKPLVLAKCSKCGKAVEAHAACSFCGNYKGKEILAIKVKTAKEAK